MENLIELVREHKKMRPLMEIQDVYKLIYQSTLGLGHLLKNHETAKDYLIDEIENIQKVIVKEVLIEDISINNSMVRVNLRPFNEKKMSPEKLFDAMLLTEKKNTSTINDFIKTWELFIKLAEQGKLISM